MLRRPIQLVNLLQVLKMFADPVTANIAIRSCKEGSVVNPEYMTARVSELAAVCSVSCTVVSGSCFERICAVPVVVCCGLFLTPS